MYTVHYIFRLHANARRHSCRNRMITARRTTHIGIIYVAVEKYTSHCSVSLAHCSLHEYKEICYTVVQHKSLQTYHTPRQWTINLCSRIIRKVYWCSSLVSFLFLFFAAGFCFNCLFRNLRV